VREGSANGRVVAEGVEAGAQRVAWGVVCAAGAYQRCVELRGSSPNKMVVQEVGATHALPAQASAAAVLHRGESSVME